jgi:hypothetical protein
VTQSVSISGPGNAPGIDGWKILCVNVEMVIDDFVDFGGALVSWTGLTTLVVRLCFDVGFTLLETGGRWG